MDPLATLNRALDALTDEDYETAREALTDYDNWRTKGGFEPVWAGRRGDRVASRCWRCLVDALVPE